MTETENNSPETKKSFKEKFITLFPILSIIGLIVGAAGGYIYYLKIGCVDGTCAITSNPWMSMLWGGILGYLLFDMFNKKKKELKDPENK
jgi:hypothetical protein